MNTSQPGFSIKQEEVVFSTKWYRIIKQTVVISTAKKPLEYYVLEKSKAIFIIPYHNQHIYLIEQFRIPVKKNSLEIPAGMLRTPREKPQHCALRELREEAGLIAKELKKIGSFYLTPGHSSQSGEVFLATKLTKSIQEPDSTEMIKEVKKYPLKTVKKFIRKGKITSAPTLASLSIFFNTLDTK